MNNNDAATPATADDPGRTLDKCESDALRAIVAPAIEQIRKHAELDAASHGEASAPAPQGVIRNP